MCAYLSTLGVGPFSMVILLKAGDCWRDEDPASRPDPGLDGGRREREGKEDEGKMDDRGRRGE